MEAPEASVVLDSSAVIAFLRDEPGASQVERLLRERRARMSTVNVAETIDVLVRVYGRTADEAVVSLDHFFAAGVESVAPSLEVARDAGEMRARLFDRRTRRLSLADCFVLATAAAGEAIVTGDATVADAARAEGLGVVALAA